MSVDSTAQSWTAPDAVLNTGSVLFFLVCILFPPVLCCKRPSDTAPESGAGNAADSGADHMLSSFDTDAVPTSWTPPLAEEVCEPTS
jgi:hypothetical protein